jgi:hypothetical protein
MMLETLKKDDTFKKRSRLQEKLKKTLSREVENDAFKKSSR